MALLMVSLVSALDMCGNLIDLNDNCTMITPSLTGCPTYNYTILNISGAVIENGTLGAYYDDIYQFNVTNITTANEGDYVALLCDGTTREFRVEKIEGTYMITAILAMIGIMALFAYFSISLKVDEESPEKWTYTGALKIFFFIMSLGAALLSIGVVMEATEGYSMHSVITIGYAAVMFITITIIFVMLVMVLHKSLKFKKEKSNRRETLPSIYQR